MPFYLEHPPLVAGKNMLSPTTARERLRRRAVSSSVDRTHGRPRLYYGERFNAWSHLLGALLALGGATWLIVAATITGDARKIIGAAVYGVTLILLYSISTLYHSLRGRVKQVLRKLDHLSIYLLIAGSYTPFCLVSLRGPWGWSLFGIVWALAIVGMLQEIKPRSEARVLSLVIYALMGWIVLVAIEPLLASLGLAGVLWLAGGGVATPSASSSSLLTTVSATGTASGTCSSSPAA